MDRTNIKKQKVETLNDSKIMAQLEGVCITVCIDSHIPVFKEFSIDHGKTMFRCFIGISKEHVLPKEISTDQWVDRLDTALDEEAWLNKMLLG